MKLNIENKYTIGLGRGAVYGTLTVDATRLSEPVLRHIFEYGLRQVLNDAIATKTDKDGNGLSKEQIFAKAEARLTAFYAGELRTRGEAEPADPVEALAHEMAKDVMIAYYKRNDLWGPFPKGTKNRFAWTITKRRAARGLPVIEEADAVREAVAAFLTANPAIRADAAAQIAKRDAAEMPDDLL